MARVKISMKGLAKIELVSYFIRIKLYCTNIILKNIGRHFTRSLFVYIKLKLQIYKYNADAIRMRIHMSIIHLNFNTFPSF